MFIYLTFLFSVLVSTQCVTYYYHLPQNENLLYCPFCLDMWLDIISTLSTSETKDQIINLLEGKNCSYFKTVLESYSNKDSGFNSLNLVLSNTEDLKKKMAEIGPAYNLTLADFQENIFETLAKFLQIDKDKTEDIMKDIDLDISFAIVSGSRINSNWVSGFNSRDNVKQTFNGTNGEKEVTFIHNLLNLTYSESNNTKAANLKLEDDLDFYIILPKDYDSMSNFNVTELTELLVNSQEKSVDIYLPKFKLEKSYDIKKVLDSLGINVHFTSDVFGMNQNIDISNIKLISSISIGESGTNDKVLSHNQSTAPLPSPSEETILFNVTQPFFFLLRDESKNANLLFGSVKNI